MRHMIIALLLVAAGPAFADDDVPGCENASSNVEIGSCVSAAYQKADEALNAFWPKVLARIDAADYVPPADRNTWKQTVIAAQRAWIDFKQADCGAVAYEWWGGSGAGIAETTCLYGHTARRLEQLEERYGDR
jgi:uncharacterized protein YecT (DUF1311 family)